MKDGVCAHNTADKVTDLKLWQMEVERPDVGVMDVLKASDTRYSFGSSKKMGCWFDLIFVYLVMTSIKLFFFSFFSYSFFI